MSSLLEEALRGFAAILGYYAMVAVSLLLLKRFTSVAPETRRKFVHILCVLSIFLYLSLFETWWVAALCSLLFALVLFPAIALLERFPQFREIVAERRTGEISSSLFIVSFMIALLIAIFWGGFGEETKFIILLSVLAWGFGDAAAALVGKRHGKRYLEGTLIEGRKTVEGTTAMFAVAFCTIFLTLITLAALPWQTSLAVALPVAVVCALVELFSRWGTDTITVPLSAALSASLFLFLLA